MLRGMCDQDVDQVAGRGVTLLDGGRILVTIKGVRETLALQAMKLETGIETHICALTDSSAAKARVETSGLKHVQLLELLASRLRRMAW